MTRQKFTFLFFCFLLMFAGASIGTGQWAFAQEDDSGASQETSQDQKEEEEIYGKQNGVLGHDIVIGPAITILGLPRLFGIAVESKYKNTWGGSFNYSFVPSITVKNVKVDFNAWDFRFKWYPAHRALFLGVGIGIQSLTGSTSKDITVSGVTTATTVNLVLDNTFVTPHVGWNWAWESGFFMGMDLGVQLSVSRTTTLSTSITNTAVLNSTEYTALKKEADDAGEFIGKIPLPLITFIKIGYFF